MFKNGIYAQKRVQMCFGGADMGVETILALSSPFLKDDMELLLW